MASNTWTNPVSDNWNNSSDWSLGQAPVATDDVFISVSGGYTVTLTSSATIASLTISDPSATLSDTTSGVILTISGALNNSGSFGVDNGGFSGGSNVTIGGLLTNAGSITIGSGNGYGALTAPTTVTATGGVSNSGTITLQGGLSPNIATLDVDGPAGLGTTGVLTGNVDLSGDSLLEFASGLIATIAANSELTIDGTSAFVADSGATSSESALQGLSTISGALNYESAPVLTTTGALTVSYGGQLNVDNQGFNGGSNVTIGGLLTNAGGVTIGSGDNYGALDAPTTVTATGGLSNTGTITLQGGLSPNIAALDVSDPAGLGTTGVLTGNVDLSGDSLLEFASGTIATIAANSELTIDGTSAFLGIAEKFAKEDMIGPVWVRQFVEGTTAIGDRTPDQWQLDAYGQVRAWVEALGLTD